MFNFYSLPPIHDTLEKYKVLSNTQLISFIQAGFDCQVERLESKHPTILRLFVYLKKAAGLSKGLETPHLKKLSQWIPKSAAEARTLKSPFINSTFLTFKLYTYSYRDSWGFGVLGEGVNTRLGRYC